ncbi:hypothetical protein [Qipengyuania qiaonensis]|nr:hypothetical protein [Qipengyuania qiaonensis]
MSEVTVLRGSGIPCERRLEAPSRPYNAREGAFVLQLAVARLSE